MLSTCIETNTRGESFIIFTVPLPHRNPVFMSMKVSEYSREDDGIVIVDSEKFLHLWRSGSEPDSDHHAVAHGSPDTWINDYKYTDAVKGFAHGRENPVPLAHICYGVITKPVISHKFLCFGRSEHQEKIHGVSFINGITRTIWLLTQGCTAFPIQCDIASARGLYQIAAAPETLCYSVGELEQVKR